MRLDIPTDDRGLLLGDGLFETVLVQAGQPAALDAHLDRLARGCGVLGLPSPEPASIRQAILASIAETGLGHTRAAVRVSWSAGSGGRGLERPGSPTPRLWVTAAASPEIVSAASLVTASVRRNEGSPVSRVKSLAYLDNVMARAQALAAGADEAVMLNNRGEVACAAAANLFWVADGRLFTPALDCGVLDGITRAKVIVKAQALGAPVVEVRAASAALAQAEGLFLTNSLIGLRPVSRLDGRAFGPDRLTADLMAALL